jgi:hypothetical protein
VSVISPVVPLLVVASNQPIPGYGVRPTATLTQQVNKGLSTGGYCAPTPNGTVVCSSSPFLPVKSSGTALPSGFLAGWQYWQASIVMQLIICAVALAVSAFLLPPIRRRFGLRRRTVVAATAPA